MQLSMLMIVSRQRRSMWFACKAAATLLLLTWPQFKNDEPQTNTFNNVRTSKHSCGEPMMKIMMPTTTTLTAMNDGRIAGALVLTEDNKGEARMVLRHKRHGS